MLCIQRHETPRRIRAAATATIATWLALPACLWAAEPLRIAVASNFMAAFAAVQADYPGELEATFGSSGLLYAQILQGRPFDVFLSADRARPMVLVEDGRADTATVYATGRLALLVNAGTPGPAWLTESKRVALANPATAPYGRAAVQTLTSLDATPQRIVALNVAQAFHFTASSAADGAFVALAQVRAQRVAAERYWLVPDHRHEPIEQVAVVVRGGREAAARTFVARLAGEPLKARIRAAGYQ